MTHRRLIVLAAAALVACSESPTEPAVSAESPDPLANVVEGTEMERAYQVTIHNLTYGQPFTPPLLATHRHGVRIFRAGSIASEGIMQLAENGNGAPLAAALEADSRVSRVEAAMAPVMPGSSLTVMVGGDVHARRLSWASMLICTNDGFTGLRGVRLPSRVGQKKTYTVGGYDAGTERNTEDFTDLVAPCPLLTGVSTDEMGTGASNPALAEGGRIRHHRGITGADDLVPSIHGWKGPVARIVVERIS